MKVPFITLLRAKLRKIQMMYRIWFLRRCGAKIGKMCKIDRIRCNWPNRIIIGNDCEIQNDVLFRVQHPFSEDNYIKIGSGVFLGNDCEFNSASNIIIGDNCLIASRNVFVDGGHETNPAKLIKDQGMIIDRIVVGSDVWIGTNCKILKGVTIGDCSIVGAGSVVNKSIPPYEIWAGAPAKFIKKRQ